MMDKAQLAQEITESDLAEIQRLMDAGNGREAMRFARERGLPLEFVRGSAKPKEGFKRRQFGKPKEPFISPPVCNPRKKALLQLNLSLKRSTCQRLSRSRSRR
jgi:hypothetical protein